MAATTTMVHVRVDENVKAQAAETLASMGLTVSDAIRVFLTRVVADKELPFALKAPNATSRVAITEASATWEGVACLPAATDFTSSTSAWLASRFSGAKMA